MANHKSAERRARQTIRRTEKNEARRSRVKTFVRSFRDTMNGTDAQAKTQALKETIRELQHAASKGVLHKRNAARRVSRLTLALNKTLAASIL